MTSFFITVGLLTFGSLFPMAYLWAMLASIRHWKRQPIFLSTQDSIPNTQLSVIVAARNESDVIQACIQSILKQNYPNQLFELIVVNDHSEDNTLAIANSQQYENLKVLNLPEGLTGKKAAIAYGIRQAKGQLVVTTDADCVVPSTWLQAIAAYYEAHHPKMILGPVAYVEGAGLLQNLQQLELAALMGITGASAQQDQPTMANGANLAYEKAVFDDMKGFQGIDHIPSGDDVLLMHKLQEVYPGSIAFLKSPEAVVETKYTKGFVALLRQRVRWAAKSTHFVNVQHQLTMLFFYLYHLAMLACLVLSSWYSPLLLVFGMLWLGKFLGELLLTQAVKADLHTSVNLFWLLPVQLVYTLLSVLIAPVSILLPVSWKGRKYDQQTSTVKPAFSKNG